MATEYRYLDLNDTCKGISSLEANKELQPNFVTAKDKKPQRKWFIPFRKVFLLLFISALFAVSGCRTFRPLEVDHLSPQETNNLKRVGDFYVRDCKFYYHHELFVLPLKVSVPLVDFYASRPKFEFEDWGQYCNDADYPYLLDIDRQLYQLVADRHLSKEEFAQFVACFVESIKYQLNAYADSSNVFDVPRYPIVSFLLGHKDCKSGAVAINALLSKIGYKTVLFGLPGHMASGVSGFPNVEPFTTQYGVDYAYIESTHKGARIGWWPKSIHKYDLEYVTPVYQTGSVTYEDLANSDSTTLMAKANNHRQKMHSTTQPQAVSVMDILNEAFGLAFKLNHN